MEKKVDFIIVGQGIAGSTLAFKLIERGYSAMVFDRIEKNHSSLVAPGLFNPITGKKMVKTWMAEELWDSFIPFYREVEEKLGKKILYLCDHYRPFSKKSDYVYHMNESEISKAERFVGQMTDRSVHGSMIEDNFGGIELKETGYVDIPEFIGGIKDYLLNKSAYIFEYVDPSEIITHYDRVQYRNFTAKKLIFCDGWKPGMNPYFDWLPFRPVKGEVLKVKLEKDIDRIFNRGVYVLPHYDGNCRVGSTYEHQQLNTEPTEKGRKYLTGKLKALVKGDFEVVSQSAGIRPATHDHRPYTGIHPEIETIGLLNGLGTKGVTLAPLFADNLVQFIEKNDEIIPEVSIERCYSLYLKSS